MRARPRQPVAARKACRSPVLRVVALSAPVLIFLGWSIQVTVGLDLMLPGATCTLGSLQNVVPGGMVPGAGVMAVGSACLQLADWVRAASRWIDEATAIAACG